MPRLTAEDRYAIWHHYNELKSISAVAELLGFNRKTVRLWVNRKLSTGSLQVKPGQGRKRQFSAAAAHKATELLLSGGYRGAKEVAAELHRLGLSEGDKPMSRTTVTRHAKAAAAATGRPMRAVRTRPSKRLTDNTMAKRLAFSNTHKTTNWANVMFTDRKKFQFRYVGTPVQRVAWVVKGQRREAKQPNHALCINMYAGITKYGVTKPHFVVGTSKLVTEFLNQKGKEAKNITSQQYKEVVAQTLLPEGKRIFSAQGISTWVLQQDNDPTHPKAGPQALKEWQQANPGSSVSLLANWPPSSPDLSPIENVWSYVQQEVDAVGCKTWEEFQECVLSTFKAVPQSMLSNLYASMRDRLTKCIELQGGKTKY